MFTRIFHFYWNLVARQKNWLRGVLILFCVGIVSGAGAYSIVPDLQNQIADMFREIIGDTFTFDFAMVLRIFVNNTTAALIMIFGGVFFGLVPFFAIFFNGFIMGYIIVGSFFAFPVSILKTLYFSFATIIPHGIFEIPAILFSAALGMRFGIEWMQKSSAPNRGDIFRKNFMSALLTIPLLIFVLFIAASVEIFISARIGYGLLSGTNFYSQ
ncbi:stage II sporulation protein M [Candidatus Uhrbacteria bacterium]|nr:stage II sporulation protein M [Candidatus Uhrbacteria bacterium]